MSQLATSFAIYTRTGIVTTGEKTSVLRGLPEKRCQEVAVDCAEGKGVAPYLRNAWLPESAKPRKGDGVQAVLMTLADDHRRCDTFRAVAYGR